MTGICQNTRTWRCLRSFMNQFFKLISLWHVGCVLDKHRTQSPWAKSRMFLWSWEFQVGPIYGRMSNVVMCRASQRLNCFWSPVICFRLLNHVDMHINSKSNGSMKHFGPHFSHECEIPLNNGTKSLKLKPSFHLISSTVSHFMALPKKWEKFFSLLCWFVRNQLDLEVIYAME
jgi:hypothetical protein